MNSYVKRLKELREDNDLSQKEVAAHLNTTQQVYSRYENGTNEIPTHHIIALSRLYNVSCDYLLGESNSKNKNDRK